LSDVFSATPRGGPSPFKQAKFDRPAPTFQVAEDVPTQLGETIAPSSPAIEDPFVEKSGPSHFDSGYFGSQFATQQTQPTQPNDQIDLYQSPQASSPRFGAEPTQVEGSLARSPEPEETRSTEGSFQSAKEEQTRNFTTDVVQDIVPENSLELKEATRPVLESPLQNRTQQPPSPQKRSPERPAAAAQSPAKISESLAMPAPVAEDEPIEDVQSPSEGSSPLRPIVRKSSLNFASLPAREPITTKKSIGNRVSRTSQLEQSRTSHYGRQTGGKSLGNTRQEDSHHDEDDEMDVDEEPGPVDPMSRLHNKTSTQRLQDQISMLGKSQSNIRPPSKSIANNTVPSTQPNQLSQALVAQEVPRQKSPLHRSVDRSPNRSPHRSPQHKPFAAPGAFPEDEDDSWIGPPNAAAAITGPSIFSPRPQLAKSHSTDVMEAIHGKDSIGGAQFSIPKRGEETRSKSPQRSPLREPAIPERTTSTLGHIKSVSTSVLRSPKKAGELPEHKKGISVSNPNPSIEPDDEQSNTPPKSPSRSYRGSPLKAAKDKFSSILKSSRGLFASSAAVSAEAKSSALSPASSRMGLNSQPSFEEALRGHVYPSQENLSKSQHSQRVPDSPGKASVRKTRASTEKEERRKLEEAREAKEAKEGQKMNDQLEKARQKVKEEARIYHLEQERVAAMQKQVVARQEQEKLAKASQVDVPRTTRSSPRKTKAQLEAEGIAAAAVSTSDLSSKNVEMSDASSMPPPAVPRPKSQIGRPTAKRPLKPGKDTAGKAKPPTVIRVDTGSQRGHQYHPSNSTLAATLQESLTAPSQANSSQGHLRNKASTSSIQSKASTSSFKSAATKALEAAARKKELDELAAQRKRDAKQELERQRAAIKEEEKRKEEQQRRQEIERQRAIQREKEQAASAADAKRSASRQAIEKRRLEMEKAKQTGAPPPAIRPQPSGDLTLAMLQDKPLPSVPSQRTDMGQNKAPRMNSAMHRPQDDMAKSISLHNAAKIPPKRPLPDSSDDHHSRPAMQRNPPSYQHNDNHSKRRKTSETFDDDEDMTEPQPKLTAPPIRQSSNRPKVSTPDPYITILQLTYCRTWLLNLCSQAGTPPHHHPEIFKEQLLFHSII